MYQDIGNKANISININLIFTKKLYFKVYEESFKHIGYRKK